MNKIYSLLIVCICYLSAIGVAFFCVPFFLSYHILIQVLLLDIIITVIIYFFSFLFKNSSIYDPYWSIIPLVILFYFIYTSNIYMLKFNVLLIFINISLWSIRLTANWIKNWKGMPFEDWRYIDMRNYSGKYFELSNFLGIHLFPTLIVFICCIPIYFVTDIQYQLSAYSFIGFFICLIGVLYEFIADYQLYIFKKRNQKNTGIINKGLWKYSRHPNYWGEILFWWGLYIYVCDVAPLYMILAPILMTLMFVYISIPWIENKIIKTRPQYKEYQKNTNILLPELAFIKKTFKF